MKAFLLLLAVLTLITCPEPKQPIEIPPPNPDLPAYKQLQYLVSKIAELFDKCIDEIKGVKEEIKTAMKDKGDDIGVFRKYSEELTLEAKKAIINCKKYAKSLVKNYITDAPPETKN